jgi:hypothetical protein
MQFNLYAILVGYDISVLIVIMFGMHEELA